MLIHLLLIHCELRQRSTVLCILYGRFATYLHEYISQQGGNAGALRGAGRALQQPLSRTLQAVWPQYRKCILHAVAHIVGHPVAPKVADRLHEAVA